MQKREEILAKLIEEAKNLRNTSGGQEVAFQKAYRWVERCEALLGKWFSVKEADKFRNTSGGIRINDPWGNLYRMTKTKVSFLEVLQEEIKAHPDFWEKELDDASKEPQGKSTREGFFIDGQYYEAQKFIRGLLKKSKKTIKIIDNYIDDNVIDLLTVKSPKVIVEILTRKIDPSERVSAQAFVKQYGGLSIRCSSAFHDRFLIIDDKDFYHLGASIKDLGNRTFMFSLMEEKGMVALLNKKWLKEWGKGTIVI